MFTSPEILGLEPDEYIQNGAAGIADFSTRSIIEIIHELRPETIAEYGKVYGLSHSTGAWQQEDWNPQYYYFQEGKLEVSHLIATRDDVYAYFQKNGMEKEKAYFLSEEVSKGRFHRSALERYGHSVRELEEYGVPQQMIETIMEIRYLFPRAHCLAYVFLATKLAWYKVHYTKEFYDMAFILRDEEMREIGGYILLQKDANTVKKALIEQEKKIIEVRKTNDWKQQKELSSIRETLYLIYEAVMWGYRPRLTDVDGK